MTKKVKNIGRLLNVPSDPRSFGDADPSRLILNKCYVGVEVEVEGVTKQIDFDEVEGAEFWKTHEDGSLRDRGLEYVFGEPLRGADIVVAIEGLCKEARRLEYKISDRTGIHVHVDIRNLTPEQLHAMCLGYAIFEKAMFQYIAPERYTSNFCVPWAEASGSVQQLGDLLFGGSDAAKINAFRGQHKYSALNIESAMRLGTVEFRHMKTTFDSEAILTWVNLCLALKKFALRYNGTPREFIALFSNGPERLCETIFERYAGLLIQTKDFRREAYKGMRLSLEMMTNFIAISEEYRKQKVTATLDEKYKGTKFWLFDDKEMTRSLDSVKAGIKKPVRKKAVQVEGDPVQNAIDRIRGNIVARENERLMWNVNTGRIEGVQLVQPPIVDENMEERNREIDMDEMAQEIERHAEQPEGDATFVENVLAQRALPRPQPRPGAWVPPRRRPPRPE